MANKPKRDAAPASPPVAGGKTAGGSGGDTTLPMSALSDAMAKAFGAGFVETIDRNTTSAGGGDSPPQDPQPSPPGGGGEPVEPEPAEPTPAEPAAPEPAPSGELEPEPDLSQPQDEPSEPTEPSAPAEPAGVTKRIRSLQAKIERLEAQLANRENGEPERPTQVDGITDPNELAARADKLETALEECDGLLTKLQYSPRTVESWLRQNKVALTDAAGNEDYSPERMGDFLTQTRQGFKQALKAVPKRREYLQQYAQMHQATMQVMPWMQNEEDPRHELMAGILQQFPQLRARPNYEYWLGCMIQGHTALQGQLKAKPAGTTARPAGRPAPAARPGVPAPAPRAVEARKVEAARAKVLKAGDRDSLSAFFEATGFAER